MRANGKHPSRLRVKNADKDGVLRGYNVRSNSGDPMMKFAFAVALSLTAVVVFAKPSTQPWRGASATTRPTTAPAAATAKLPTPAELIEKMKAMKEKKAAAPKIAYFDLSRRITEKPADFAFFGQQDVQTLNSVLDRLRQAREDKSVRAVLITMGDESPSFA